MSVTVTMPMTMPSVVSTERSFVRDNGTPGDAQTFAYFRQEVHLWTGSSLAMSPSRMRMMRSECRATSSS